MAHDVNDAAIFLGRSFDRSGGHRDETLLLRLANRHGLITGATGTGKTVTLQVMAEGFSRAGVPVFAADIKGDLSGLAAMGAPRDFLERRAQEVGRPYQPDRFPVTFWDVFGAQGHPVRATVSELGPLLLSRLMGLNATQEGVLNIAFRVADEDGLLLLDLKDLRAVLTFIAEQAPQLSRTYGNVSTASIGAIQRQLLVLENQGAEAFFGEPALDIRDLMRRDADGRGVINILAADKLMAAPRLYACFLLWLLSELFEELPEVGDVDQPRLVFFFDEAHLLFEDAPPALLDKVEQVVRLVRSKGVGIYFVTQNPLDVPDKVLSQLGNRIQHALRAFTPRDQKAVRAAAETFRPNPALDTAAVITELGKGEALVSTLEGNGVPSRVERTLIAPPAARVGPITLGERRAILAQSPLARLYDAPLDRHSAFEMLRDKAGRGQAEAPPPAGPWSQPSRAPAPAGRSSTSVPRTGAPPRPPRSEPAPAKEAPARASTRMSTTELVVRQVARSVASQVGTQIGRAILRGILGGRQR